MSLYPENSSYKGNNNAKKRKYVKPTGRIFPSKHHKNARKQISKYRGALGLYTHALVLTVNAFDRL